MARKTGKPIKNIYTLEYDPEKPKEEQPGQILEVVIYDFFNSRDKIVWGEVAYGDVDAQKAAKAAHEGNEESIEFPIKNITNANIAVADRVIVSIKDQDGKTYPDQGSKIDWLLDNTTNGEKVLEEIGAIGIGTFSPNVQSGSTK